MKKLKIYIEKDKVKIYKLLIGTMSTSKMIAMIFWITSTLLTLQLAQLMAEHPRAYINLIEKEPLFVEVCGHIILISLKFCFMFWFIYAVSKFCSHVLLNKMDACEMEEIGIKSSLKFRSELGKNYAGIRKRIKKQTK